jgi:hypothetical protein
MVGGLFHADLLPRKDLTEVDWSCPVGC